MSNSIFDSFQAPLTSFFKGLDLPKPPLTDDLLAEIFARNLGEGKSLGDIATEVFGHLPESKQTPQMQEELENFAAGVVDSLQSNANSSNGIDDAGIGLITEFEGYSETVYSDTGGHPTIGYGHLITDDEQGHYDNAITRDQALDLLRGDVQEAVDAVNELVTVDLNQNQFNALVSFVYNVGRGNFEGSTLLRELNQGNYNRVPDELRRWTRSGGEVVRGLERRREAEADLFTQP